MNDEPETTTAVAVRQTEPNPLALIQAAIQQGLDPDKLTKLFDLQERHMAAQAEKAFADAVAAFQRECPLIHKGRQADAGRMKYKFAGYDDIWRVAGPICAKHGIAITFDTAPVDGMLKVTCKVRVGTHMEPTDATLPIPAGTVNDTQLFGQAVSYGKRYALCAALNIVVTNEDDDGHSNDGRRPQRQAQPPREPNVEELCQQACAALEDAGDTAYLATVWGQIEADKPKFGPQRWDRIVDAHAKAKERLAPKPKPQPAPPPSNGQQKPAENLSLTEILTRMNKSSPADAADLCVRLKWLSGALARRLPDFAESELFDCIENAVVMPDSGRMADLSPEQCGPAWAAVKVYVEQAAKQPAKV